MEFYFNLVLFLSFVSNIKCQYNNFNGFGSWRPYNPYPSYTQQHFVASPSFQQQTSFPAPQINNFPQFAPSYLSPYSSQGNYQNFNQYYDNQLEHQKQTHYPGRNYENVNKNRGNSNQNRPTQSPTGQANLRRISAIKCEEYKNQTFTTITGGGLVLNPSSSTFGTLNCDISEGLIVGGGIAKVGEFPHMASIGFQTQDGQISFRCGGSLISEKFVLTAAHCKSYSDNGIRNYATVVRLGATKITNRQAKDFKIKNFIRHEQYNKRNFLNDIAVIELNEKVNFDKTTRPACLLQPELSLPQNKKVIATGWGSTEKTGGQTTPDLMKVTLDLLDCENDGENVVTENHICAGVLKGGQDTCQGDSGGPIQIILDDNKCISHIVGVTSYGNVHCAGKNSPSIYTRVTSYLNWIESKVWPH